VLGKLFLSPLVMWAVLQWWVPIDDPALRGAVLLTSALPMLGIFTILSQRHGHGAISAAALLVTTVVSFVSLSALLWLLRLYPL
jgi:malonate transporter